MKISAVLVSLCAIVAGSSGSFLQGASAFSTIAFVQSSPASPATRSLGVVTEIYAADPKTKNDEEEGLDLNLEEMFDMFDAADKEEDFDDSIKKVKGE